VPFVLMLTKHIKAEKIQSSNFKIWDLSTCQTIVQGPFENYHFQMKRNSLNWETFTLCSIEIVFISSQKKTYNNIHLTLNIKLLCSNKKIIN
jgi:hypothetical protein